MGDFLHTVYCISYYAGIQTMRLYHRIIRFFAFIFSPIAFFFRRTVGKLFQSFFGNVKKAFLVFFRSVKTAWKRHPLLGLLQIFRSPWQAIARYPSILRTIGSLAAVAGAVTALVLTLRYWTDIRFAVALEQGNELIGYVADESVLQNGAALATERLRESEETVVFNQLPTMKLAVVPGAQVLNETQVCDLLLKQLTVPSQSACGIYINGTLQGTVENREEAQVMLQSILDESKNGQEAVTASFFETVDLVEGLYPASCILQTDEMRERLMSEAVDKEFYTVQPGDTLPSIADALNLSVSMLYKLNPSLTIPLHKGQILLIRDSEPHLQVLVSGTIEYDQEIPFTTKRIADAAEYEGYERIRINGENGKNHITAVASYLDGVEQSCVITKSEVIVEPVTRIIAYGTKALKKDEKGKNRFIWPLPYTKHITCYFGQGGHGGIDINDNGVNKQEILAAASGKVIIAAYRKGTTYGSYGKYILIDHGNGYQTLYAHCSELLVEPGDEVIQGQRIALVGSTGQSTAPHLHFEIHLDNRRVNPLSFY